MSDRRRPAAPRSLRQAGRRFWRDILAEYDLSPAELELLRQACRLVDLLDRADVELIDAEELTTEGSAGQVKAHPLLAATAVQRHLLAELVRALALPMPGEQEGSIRSPAAHAAAQARWRARRGG